MNLQEFAKEILPVVQAAAEGKEIEYMGRFCIIPESKWKPYLRDGFQTSCIYRIKPERKVIGVVNIYGSGPVGGCYSARYIADSMADATREFIVTIYRQPDGSVTTEVDPCKPE